VARVPFIHPLIYYDYELPFVSYDGRKHAIESLYPHQRLYEKLDSAGIITPFEYVGRMPGEGLLFQEVESESERRS